MEIERKQTTSENVDSVHAWRVTKSVILLRTFVSPILFSITYLFYCSIRIIRTWLCVKARHTSDRFAEFSKCFPSYASSPDSKYKYTSLHNYNNSVNCKHSIVKLTVTRNRIHSSPDTWPDTANTEFETTKQTANCNQSKLGMKHLTVLWDARKHHVRWVNKTYKQIIKSC